MKISSIHRNVRPNYGPSAAKGGQSFSDALGQEARQQEQRKVGQMLDRIKTLGQRLKVSRSPADAAEYKRQIQEFLSYILGNCYRLRRGANQYGQWLVWVETVNNHIDEITKALLEQEKTTIDLASSIDKLTGLLIDLYDSFVS